MTLQQLKQAIKDNKTLIWRDPDPIENNNYTIIWIEDLSNLPRRDYQDYPILIHYGEGSEAQVYIDEIELK